MSDSGREWIRQKYTRGTIQLGALKQKLNIFDFCNKTHHFGHLLLWPEVERHVTGRKIWRKWDEYRIRDETDLTWKSKIAAGNFVRAAGPLKCELFTRALVLPKVYLKYYKAILRGLPQQMVHSFKNNPSILFYTRISDIWPRFLKFLLRKRITTLDSKTFLSSFKNCTQNRTTTKKLTTTCWNVWGA